MEERWCPRCDWVGATELSTCTSCGIPLLGFDPPAEPRRTPGVASSSPLPARSMPLPPVVAQEHAPARPAAADPPRSRIARQIRVGWAAAVPIVVVVALVASAFSGSGNGSSASIRSPQVTTTSFVPPGRAPLPSTLAFLMRGSGGDLGAGLWLSHGPDAGTGPATTPPDGRGAVAFAWSPDGSHLAVIDGSGGLRLVGESQRIPGPVRDFAFSHDGTLLAVCSGVVSPSLTIRLAGGTLQPVLTGIRGCHPAWSPDDNYVSYLVPPGQGSAGHHEVVNAHVGARFRIAGTGPLVWAPGSSYAITPVTTLSGDCTAVQVMDPRGGRAHVVALVPGVEPPPAGVRCPETMLAWSADARWLAVAIRKVGTDPARVFVFEPRTGVVDALPVPGLGLTPQMISWSPLGDSLLVAGTGAGGRSFAIEATPSGERPQQAIPAADTSWSPDGVWILGRGTSGWAAFDASDPMSFVPLPALGPDVSAAEWCCPPVEAVRSSPGGFGSGGSGVLPSRGA